VRCSGDTLETCNAALTGFDPTKVCGAGLCDAAGKECDDCKSGAVGCLGTTPRTCNSTGHWTSLTPCSGSTPACSAGVCVASGFPGSTLISGTDSTLINGWIGVSAAWTRCYAKSVDGASPYTFHAKCDGKGPSVVVAKLSTGKIIGAYASLSWASLTPGNWMGDEKTFVFSLTNSFKHDYITTIFPTSYTQWTGADRGPAFGGGHDWMIDTTMNGGYCYMGHTFHCRVGADGGTDTACRNDLCGTFNGWTVDELEVWVK